MEIALGMAFLLLVVAILIFYIWYQTEAVHLGYKIGELRGRVLKLKEDIRTLEAQKASLLSLQRIEGLARNELKLTDPKEDQIIYGDEHF